jgi:hypothetical protein
VADKLSLKGQAPERQLAAGVAYFDGAVPARCHHGVAVSREDNIAHYVVVATQHAQLATAVHFPDSSGLVHAGRDEERAVPIERQSEASVHADMA